EAHEALAVALGPSPEGEEALRRALALSPWSGEVHDRLGLQLWARGARAEGAAELEESMFRFPSLASHPYLGPAGQLETRDAGRLIHALDDGAGSGRRLARAARDYLEAGDRAGAERSLLDALLQSPGQGDLYRTLAVDVYAARGDFSAAENVLHAGVQNAFDMLPVYHGVT